MRGAIQRGMAAGIGGEEGLLSGCLLRFSAIFAEEFTPREADFVVSDFSVDVARLGA